MATFAETADLPVSEKNNLVQVEPSQRLVLWTLDTGAVYRRVVDHYTIDAKVDATSLTEASSKVLAAGEWFFDPEDLTLYVRMSDDSNPQSSFVSATFRLFFSIAPVVLSHDLSSTGDLVEYEARVRSVSRFKQEIDTEKNN